jgi:hypothetical protein
MTNEDDRFSDVAEQLKQTEKEALDNEEALLSEKDSKSPVEEQDQQVNEESDSPQQPVDPDGDESTGGPPFSFDETDMHGFYVRDETWHDLTRARSSVTAACSMFDVPEFEGREFQDACLQVVADHADEVALQILRERDIEADEQRVQEIVEMLSSQEGE